MKRLLKNNKIDFFWGIYIISILAFISIIWYKEITTNCEHNFPKTIIITAGILGIILFWFLYFRQKLVCQFRQKSKLFDGLFVCICFLVLLYLIYHYEIWGEFFKNDIGGVFAISIGLATILGTYWAIRSIVEMKHTITDYPQLMDRLAELINNTSSKEIRIVSYFILPGYWQVRISRYRERFEQALSAAKDKIKIACITPEENLSIVIDVAQKGVPLYPQGATAENIIEFQSKCENILSSFEKYPPKRLKWKDLPYYYFFVTDERAIIVTPVGLPKINETLNRNSIKEIADQIKSGNREGLTNRINALLLPYSSSKNAEATVDTLGFETTDQRIIDRLWALFDEYYNKNSEPLENNPTQPINNNSSFPDPNPASNADENVNVAINKTTNTTDVLVEVSNKITVKVNIQD